MQVGKLTVVKVSQKLKVQFLLKWAYKLGWPFQTRGRAREMVIGHRPSANMSGIHFKFVSCNVTVFHSHFP